jgi:hypothetical protein
MNGFIFASGVNHHGNDSTGAFRPGAEAFKRIHSIPQPVFYFDHNDAGAKLRKKILDRLMTLPCDDPDGLDVVAYFGHGVQNGLPSAHFYMDHVQELAAAIIATSKHEVRVILYACSAGKLPTCFASALATAMNTTDAAVFGHHTVGHSFANPYVTTFDIGHVGRYVVQPGSSNWHTWSKAIRDGNAHPRTKTPWARFPFQCEDEVRAELGDFVPGGVCRPVGQF